MDTWFEIFLCVILTLTFLLLSAIGGDLREIARCFKSMKLSSASRDVMANSLVLNFEDTDRWEGINKR